MHTVYNLINVITVRCTNDTFCDPRYLLKHLAPLTGIDVTIDHTWERSDIYLTIIWNMISYQSSLFTGLRASLTFGVVFDGVMIDILPLFLEPARLFSFSMRLSRIGGVSVHKVVSGLVGKIRFCNSTLVNGGCTNEQDNKDK